MPRRTRLDQPTQSQRKRRGRYLEAQRAKKSDSDGNRRKRRNISKRRNIPIKRDVPRQG